MTEGQEPQELRGGVNVVRRRGEAVHRPASPAAAAIHRLLRHLHAAGFHAAPEPLGFDVEGNEILTFLDGEVYEALPSDLRTPELLASAARLLRGLHDASATFETRPDDRWLLPARSPVEVICHGDAAPYNCVVKNGLAVGFIDFDAAHPGPRVWDLAYAVYRFAPLHAPTNPDSFGSPVDQGRRAAYFCRVYGSPADAHLLDVVVERLRALIDFMREQAAQGNEAFQRHIAEGHADLYEVDISYVREQHAALLAAFAQKA